MGFAHGTMLKEQIHEIVPQFMEFVAERVDHFINFLPPFIRGIIEVYGVEAALELTYDFTRAYTPQRFFDEMQGIADGSGVDYMTIVRIHMFPELIKAACSMFGTWGPAVQNNPDVSLLQLRALDWGTNGPMQKWPVVFVYHPNKGNGNTFSILSWAGFIGALTGYSSSPFGVCEKYYWAYNGSDSLSGYPWMFLLRDILQYDTSIDAALNRIYNARRTCAIWVGLGDGATFRALQYSYEFVNVFSDKNFPEYEGHPTFPGVVYIDKRTQPSHNPCMGSLMQKYYGSYSPAITYQYITALEQTGDMHIMVMDFKPQMAYVANASPYVNGTSIPAYDRPFVQLNMGSLFSLQNTPQ